MEAISMFSISDISHAVFIVYWTLICVEFMDVIMGDIPIYNLTTLCLNMTLLYVLIKISRMSSWEIYRYIT